MVMVMVKNAMIMYSGIVDCYGGDILRSGLLKKITLTVKIIQGKYSFGKNV